MDQILARIKEAYHLETDAEVAEFLGIKPSTLSMQKNRGRLDLARIIEKCSDLNKNWLLDGEGPMWRKSVKKHQANGIPIYSSIEVTDTDELKFEGDKVSSINTNGQFPKHLQENFNGDLLGYIISADSMEPTITKNDIAFLDENDKKPGDGAIFLITFDNTVLCRRVQEKPGDVYSVSSDNKAYEPFEVEAGDNGFNIIGKVIWVMQSI